MQNQQMPRHNLQNQQTPVQSQQISKLNMQPPIQYKQGKTHNIPTVTKQIRPLIIHLHFSK